MVKRGSTTFSATKVAKAGLAASAALERIFSLEKEVSRLRHHVSVLSKRNHVLSKELERKGDDCSKVASPVRVQEPESPVVAEPEVRMSGTIVEEGEEDVWVAPVAGVAEPPVAETRVAVEVDEPEVALVRLPKGKRRRTCEEEGSEAEESEEEVVEVGVIVAASIPRGPKGYVAGTPGGRGRNSGYVVGAPVGPRSGQFGRGLVNPNFPMFFNRSRGFPGDREKWPAGRGRGYR